jgi:hypothetical protein
MELRLEHQITRMTNRFAGVVTVVTTLLFGALHLWPAK